MIRAEEIIRRKRDGGTLSEAEIAGLVAGYTAGEIPDYQLSAWLMAVYFRGLDGVETRALTRAMLHSGRVLALPPGAPVADKHSTGGVGDKTSLIIAPLAACCGIRVPMISGRGLGHTGGTLDKLESIPGFRTRLSLGEFEAVLERLGCAMIGQTEEIAPADRKLYALRDVTATVESLPLITASILSKKLAEGLDALLLDVKFGDGAFMQAYDDARALALSMLGIAREMGVRAEALLTDMEQPLGEMVGNALEVEECLAIMRGDALTEAQSALRELALELTARMVALARQAGGGPAAAALEPARAECQRHLAAGAAMERFQAMAEAQGAEPGCLESPARLPRARHESLLAAPRAGYVRAARARALGTAAMLLGAGRRQLSDAIDPAAGLRLQARLGDWVEAGAPLCTFYYNLPERLDAARALALSAFELGGSPPEARRLVREVLGS